MNNNNPTVPQVVEPKKRSKWLYVGISSFFLLLYLVCLIQLVLSRTADASIAVFGLMSYLPLIVLDIIFTVISFKVTKSASAYRGWRIILWINIAVIILWLVYLGLGYLWMAIR